MSNTTTPAAAPSIAQAHRDNGLHAIQRLAASFPFNFVPDGADTDVVNIDTISSGSIVIDLADGTSIRIDAERYAREG